MPFKQSFSLNNNPFVAGVNYHPGDNSWSNTQANAQNVATQDISIQISGFSGMDSELSGYEDFVINQQFVGESPLVDEIATNRGNMPHGVFFFDRNGDMLYKYFDEDMGVKWGRTDFRYVRSKNMARFNRALTWSESFYTINRAFELSEPANVIISEYTSTYYMILPTDRTYWSSFLGEWGVKSLMPGPHGTPPVGHEQIRDAFYGERWKYVSGVPLRFP